MKREELQKMKKLAGLLTEELDISWNPFEYDYEYQSIQTLMIKTAKEYLKKAGLNPDQEYPVYTRIGLSNYRSTTSEEENKTVDKAVEEFLNKIRQFYPSADKWVADMNYTIEDEWIYDHQRHADDEVDMDDFDEETEFIHDKDELVNKIMYDGINSSYKPNVGVIVSNISSNYKHKLYMRISTNQEDLKEDLDVSWNPYDEAQQEHCLLATKCRDENIQHNLYMNHGEINNPETNKKEIKRLLWPEAKKVKGDGYDMYYYFNDMIDAWLFILDLSPKSSNYEKAVETITSPGGVMFSSDSNQLLELCKQMILTLNPILDKEVFKWR